MLGRIGSFGEVLAIGKDVYFERVGPGDPVPPDFGTVLFAAVECRGVEVVVEVTGVLPTLVQRHLLRETTAFQRQFRQVDELEFEVGLG